jgi:hypothetical protein
METTQTYTPAAAAPPNFEPGTVSVPQKDTTGSYSVFTVADLIANVVKANNPMWKAGGLLRPGAHTLKYCGGYIRRFEITPLRQHMESDHVTKISPSERKHMVGAYSETTGRVNADGSAETVIRGQTKTGAPDGLLRQAVYPADEIQNLTGQVDGLVTMPVRGPQERHLAQTFLFPNWPEMLKGLLPMPETETQLRAYFLKRLTAAGDDSLRIAIAEAALKSVDDYKTWCEREASTATAQYEEAKVKGWPWHLGEDAGKAFTFLSIPRPDNLARSQASQIDKLTDTMELENRKLEMEIAAMQGGQAPVPSPPSEIPMQQAATDPVMEEAGPPDNTDTFIRCAASTKSGNPCGNAAEEDGFCKLPAHKPSVAVPEAGTETL